MEYYKTAKANSFFDSLSEGKRILLNHSDDDDDNQVLDPQKLQSFLDVLPNFIQFLNEPNSLDDQNVSISIESFYNFARFNPKEKISQVIIDSNAIDVLVKYGSNNISENFSNPIFKQNILRVFNIFAEMSKSDDEFIIMKMIQKGVLALCFNNCFIVDDEFNKTLSMILDFFIIKSVFSRSLVYSSGILSSFLSNAEESTESIPLPMLQFISGITMRFVKFGPTASSKKTQQMGDVEKLIDESNKFWDSFMENYYGDTIFIKEYFDDFVLHGIVFSEGYPIFEIIKNLITLDDDLTVLNALKSLYYLVSRDSHIQGNNKICEDIIYGRIPFISYFPDFIDKKNLKIIKYALKILTNATYPTSIDYNDTLLNDLAKIIIDFLTNNNELEFKYDEKIIAFAAQVLLNILVSVNNFTYIEDEENCEKFLLFIYHCLRLGTFKIRKAVLYFYLIFVCGYFTNPHVYKSFQENMVLIASIAEVNPNVHLNIHIIKCLKYIFNNEEEKIGNKQLLEQFISPSIDGFRMIWNFKVDESNPDLAHKAEKFIDEIYDYYDIEGISFDENQFEYGGEQYREEDPDHSDIFYKTKY